MNISLIHENNSIRYRVLYLPVEIKNREFYGKLLLATKATEAGWIVVLGGRRERKKIGPLLPQGFF
jgi:hypothetical protein